MSGHFSFNVKGGRSEACHGNGVIKIEMHFLPNVCVTCKTCKSHRHNLYEPMTGLHFENVRKLREFLHSLVRQGNHVVDIEHYLNVSKLRTC